MTRDARPGPPLRAGRRFRNEDEYDYPPVSPYVGGVNELTAAPDPESDGLLGPDGRPIERPPKPRRWFGFHDRAQEESE